MHLYFSAVIAVDRATGKPEIIAYVVNPLPGNENVGPILAEHARFFADTEEATGLRAKYSDCLAIIENGVRACHHFPDVAAESKAADDDARRSAKLAENRALRAQLAAHEGAADSLRAKLFSRAGFAVSGARLAAPSPSDLDGIKLAAAASGAAPLNPPPPAPVSTGTPPAGPVVTDRKPAADAPPIPSAAAAVAKGGKPGKPGKADTSAPVEVDAKAATSEPVEVDTNADKSES